MVFDRGFRRVFVQLCMLRQLVRVCLGPRLDALLDWDSPLTAQLPAKLVTGELALRISDLVWRVGWKGPEADCVYLMLEFQSTPHRFMPARTRAYGALLQEGLLSQGIATPPVGQVISIVVYTGLRPWRVPLEAAALVAASENLAAWSPPPSARYHLVAASAHADWEPGEWSDVKVLFRLLTTPPQEWEDLLVEVDRRVRGAGLRQAFAGFILGVLARDCKGGELPELEGLRGATRMMIDRIQEWRAAHRAELRRREAELKAAQRRREAELKAAQRRREAELKAAHTAELRTMLVSAVDDRFGAEAASRFGALIADLAGIEVLRTIQSLILAAADEDTLMRGVRLVRAPV